MANPIEEGRALAEKHNRDGEGFKNAGRKNAYVCEDCDSYIVTIDREPGVTPFLKQCGNCNGMAQSKMYRVAEHLTPTHEWYRPETVEGLQPSVVDHISNGGLILRAIPGLPDEWTRPAPMKSKHDIRADIYEIAERKAEIERKLEQLQSDTEPIEAKKSMSRQQRRYLARKGGKSAPDEIEMYGEVYRKVKR